MISKVSIVRFVGDYPQCLESGLSLIGGLRIPDAPVVIKPNLCTSRDSTGVATTNLGIMRAIIDVIFGENGGAEVKIVEADSVGKRTEVAFTNLGYALLEREYREQGYNVSLMNLSEGPLVSVSVNGSFFKSLKLHEILTQPKLFISVAQAKTHSLTRITGALKNQFGCLPKRGKDNYHGHIDEVISDVNRVIQPDLCVIDAVKGLEGVTRGRVREIGALILGREPASVDSVLARVMGFDASEVRHVILAEKFGLGSSDPEIVGEKAESVQTRFKRNGGLLSSASKYVPARFRPTMRKIYHALGGKRSLERE